MTALHEFRGVRYKLCELANLCGMDARIIRQRLAHGWTVEQALCILSVKQRRAGVVMNFPPFEGTGAGSTAQEIPEITFSKQADNE